MTHWWDEKSLSAINSSEWESLCDGCGKCCRLQLEDDDGQRATTSVVCRYMDMKTCGCTVYGERTVLVPTCIKPSPENLDAIHWMADACSWRLLRDGKGLPEWHPLVSGNSESVHSSPSSVRDKVISEDMVKEDDLEELILQWH